MWIGTPWPKKLQQYSSLLKKLSMDPIRQPRKSMELSKTQIRDDLEAGRFLKINLMIYNYIWKLV